MRRLCLPLILFVLLTLTSTLAANAFPPTPALRTLPLSGTRPGHFLARKATLPTLAATARTASPSRVRVMNALADIGTWSLAASMGTTHDYHTATLLPSGQVLSTATEFLSGV
jgi:hypothetical protein